MSAVFKAMCLMLFGILAVGFAWAQVSTGTIVGTVRDNNGGVVPNVTVTLTEIATGQVHETHTSELGTFNAQFMPLGTYSVSAAATGFKTQVLHGIWVNHSIGGSHRGGAPRGHDYIFSGAGDRQPRNPEHAAERSQSLRSWLACWKYCSGNWSGDQPALHRRWRAIQQQRRLIERH
jgi:hypothetical protein